MTTTKRFVSCLALGLCFLAAAARAQTPQVSTVNVAPERGRVRVAAVGEVYDLKIEVLDEAGEVVFEGVAAAGRQLDWKLTDSRGARVQPGTYTVTVSYLTQAGRQRKRVEQVTVTDGAGESAQPEPQAVTPGPAPQAVGTITGAGTSGKLAKFNGTNSIANSGVTEFGGKIGIGTASPPYKLTVNSGGTTVISATNTAAGDPGGSAITGTGAQGVASSASSVGGAGGIGVVGKGGKGGNNPRSVFGSIGGDGVVGIGGDGGDSTEINAIGGIGVRGIGGSHGGIGVFGLSTNIAVRGETENGYGVYGQSQGGYAVFGISATPGYAGYFSGRVQMDGNTTISNPYTLSFGSSTRQMLNLWSTQYGIGVQAAVQYYRTGGGFAWYRGGAHNGAEFNSGGGVTLMKLDSAGNLYTSGAVNPPSDRNLKANFSAVNPRSVLERLARVPVQSWNYRSEGANVRHLGPVAQDFRAAFRLGADDKTIATVDADGVMMASIQALYQMMREKDKQIARLQAELNQVRRAVRRGRAGRR